ncbi:hypothetical protein ABIC10_002093 [Bradyrhizobium sp. S3.2.12]
MRRHYNAMASIWPDVAWGGPTATTSLGGTGGVVAGDELAPMRPAKNIGGAT